jgi:hypothetical protein
MHFLYNLEEKRTCRFGLWKKKMHAKLIKGHCPFINKRFPFLGKERFVKFCYLRDRSEEERHSGARRSKTKASTKKNQKAQKPNKDFYFLNGLEEKESSDKEESDEEEESFETDESSEKEEIFEADESTETEEELVVNPKKKRKKKGKKEMDESDTSD